MTIKTALFNLPYGGGKGGIIADLQHLPKKDQEGICRAYVKSIYRDIGPKTDIPAPDLGSNSEMMDWMNDEYKKLTGEKSNGTFTGKTIEGGGSLGRTEATGYGVSYVTQYYVNKYMDEQGSYILQGFGNVGSHTALFMNKMLPKYKLLAVGDHTGYYYNKNGFDINYLFEYNKKNKSLGGITCDNKINKSVKIGQKFYFHSTDIGTYMWYEIIKNDYKINHFPEDLCIHIKESSWSNSMNLAVRLHRYQDQINNLNSEILASKFCNIYREFSSYTNIDFR
jgi:glutamate dehydrogenase/leucine dehydrogenase